MAAAPSRLKPLSSPSCGAKPTLSNEERRVAGHDEDVGEVGPDAPPSPHGSHGSAAVMSKLMSATRTSLRTKAMRLVHPASGTPRRRGPSPARPPEARVEAAQGVDDGPVHPGALEAAVEAVHEDLVGVELALRQLDHAAGPGRDGGVERLLERRGVVAVAGRDDERPWVRPGPARRARRPGRR